jgi:uncharacterized protein YdhG (YjbR/CyaY superfamily)
MTETKHVGKATQPSGKRTTGTSRVAPAFSPEERAAAKTRAEELRAEARRSPRASEAEREGEVLAAIAGMPPADRAMAERLHAFIKASAPALAPRTWYGMPAYAKDGNTVCFFQPAYKFKTRYGELGFSDKANLDDGEMWPTRYALMKWTAASEARIRALLKRAVG